MLPLPQQTQHNTSSQMLEYLNMADGSETKLRQNGIITGPRTLDCSICERCLPSRELALEHIATEEHITLLNNTPDLRIPSSIYKLPGYTCIACWARIPNIKEARSHDCQDGQSEEPESNNIPEPSVPVTAASQPVSPVHERRTVQWTVPLKKRKYTPTD